MIRFESPYKNLSFPVQEFYYHRDRLGNVTEISNFDGDVVQRYVYDSFGNVTIYDDGGNQIEPTNSKFLKNPFMFTGREYDPETGCYYYRARYYCPDMGRFISEDPIGFAGSGNFYSYSINNPTNRRDPFGLESYLASRDLNNPYAGLFISHNFIIVIDDNGKRSFYSYGELPNGKLGLLPQNHPTTQEDMRAFVEADVVLQRINAPDDVVKRIAESIISSEEYSLVGANSNSAAQTVANKSTGMKVPTPSSSYGGAIGSDLRIPLMCPSR